ncbi:MAG TPA: TetR/AcrR family transcriptional regulator [Acidimicrobiales bacterium]
MKPSPVKRPRTGPSVRPLRYLDDPDTLASERRAFVDAALELLERSDSLDVRVSEIVHRCGGHNAAFYRIFGSKEGLLMAAVAEAVERTARVLRRRVGAAASPDDAVARWVEVLMSRAATARATAATLPFALDRHRILHAFPESEAVLTAPLREPLTEVFRSGGVAEAETIATAAFEMVMSRQATWIAVRHRPSRAEVGTYIALVRQMAGL